VVLRRSSIRGGTDGSQLTARGLPTPNLFTGWHNAHGPLEWSSLHEMTTALHVLLGVLDIYSHEHALDTPEGL
jgi:tripeptide aminopeptidase